MTNPNTKVDTIDLVQPVCDALGLDASTVIQVLVMFSENIFGDMDALKEAIEHSHYTNIRNVSHKISGTSANLRLMNIHHCAQRIELLGLNHWDGDYTSVYRELEMEIEVFQFALALLMKQDLSAAE